LASHASSASISSDHNVSTTSSDSTSEQFDEAQSPLNAGSPVEARLPISEESFDVQMVDDNPRSGTARDAIARAAEVAVNVIRAAVRAASSSLLNPLSPSQNQSSPKA
jgi:hypothetical protein